MYSIITVRLFPFPFWCAFSSGNVSHLRVSYSFGDLHGDVMKALVSQLPVAATVLILVAFGILELSSQEHSIPPAPQAVPVVVELFTSEGCSSCPPADAFLAKLAEQGPAHNLQIVALEEHVDYWDDQGWRDPFSSHHWTIRQDAYAGVLGNKNPYTPQIVVDGSVECSGGRPQLALQAIVQESAKARTPVSLSQGPSDKPGSENFSVQIGKLAPSAKGGAAEVWLAITETGLHSSVTRGENAGHELSHAAVVRSMRKVGEAKPDRDVAFSGDAAIPIRNEWKRDNLKAVAFVQEKNSLRILGAAEIPLHR